MKGRKKIYDRPVHRNITIEEWVDNIIEDLSVFGVRPADIMMAGLVSILKADGKMPQKIINSVILNVKPRAEELLDMVSYYENMNETLKIIPPVERPKPEETPTPQKWVDEYHAVKYLQTGEVALLINEAYEMQQTLFELMDDNEDLNWNNLPKYNSVESFARLPQSAANVSEKRT